MKKITTIKQAIDFLEGEELVSTGPIEDRFGEVLDLLRPLEVTGKISVEPLNDLILRQRAIQMLRERGILKEKHTQWWVNFADGSQQDLVQLMVDFKHIE